MRRTWRPGRRGALTAAACACATTAIALLAFSSTPAAPPAPPQPSRSGMPRAISPPVQAAATPALPRSRPTRISAKRIGLNAVIEPVGLDAGRAVAVPSNPGHAGWYTGSPSPGEAGNAIVVGHVDSRTGPAVFYALGALRKDDSITVTRRDGRTARFTVTGTAVWRKNHFPSARVYGPSSQPRLTLITCAGWDDDHRTYRSNLVITARLQP